MNTMLSRFGASSITTQASLHRPAPSAQLARVRLVECRAFQEPEVVEDTPGVESLLARDRKGPKVQPELADAPFGGSEAASSSASGTSASQERASVLKTKRQRREEMAKAAGVEAGSEAKGPKKCKEAIDAGLELFQEKQYQQAIAMFSLALELPGNGAYRLPTSPREYSCPSDAEENAALYNMACAYAQLGQKDSALTCLEAVLENGYSDYNGMRSDPDLRPLGAGLQQLVGKFDSPVAQVTKGLFGMFGDKKEMVSDTERKPWIMW